MSTPRSSPLVPAPHEVPPPLRSSGYFAGTQQPRSDTSRGPRSFAHSGASAVLCEGLRKSFPRRGVVLDGLDLAVARATVHGLLGPNGAGKTTAIQILSTLQRFDSGRASVAGCDVARDPAGVRARIGVAGQYAALDEVLTGRQNLELFGRLHHLRARAARARAAELLARFRLESAADRPVRHWSGGMRRRLDLAVSMIRDAQVLFLDEPSTGLDPRSREEVWDAVRELAAAGTTVLLTTQYLEEADRLCSRISLIDQGRVVAEGSPDELKSRVGGSLDDAFLRLTGEPLGLVAGR